MTGYIPGGLISGFEKPKFEVREWESETEETDFGRDSSETVVCKLKGLIFRNEVICEPWTVTIHPLADVHLEQEALVIEDGVIFCIFPFRTFIGNWMKLSRGLCRVHREETAEKILEFISGEGERFPVTQEMIGDLLVEADGKGAAALLRILNRLHLIPEKAARAILLRIPDLHMQEKVAGDVKAELIRAVRSDQEVNSSW